MRKKGFFKKVDILSNLKRCHLQIANLKKLIFMNKNWLDDSRGGCKSHFNLVELIENDLKLEKKLEQFEGSIE